MPDLLPERPIDLRQQIEAVEREIHMREKVYPDWVARKRMRPEKADYELKAMRAVLATLTKLRDGANG